MFPNLKIQCMVSGRQALGLKINLYCMYLYNCSAFAIEFNMQMRNFSRQKSRLFDKKQLDLYFRVRINFDRAKVKIIGIYNIAQKTHNIGQRYILP